MVKLPTTFTDRGSPVIPRARLSIAGSLPKIDDNVKCFGRGDNVEGPGGDPALTSGDNEYRSADFKILSFDAATTFKVGYGQFREKIERGDSGGPCFAVTKDAGSEEEFVVVGLINNGIYKNPPTSDGPQIYTFLGSDVIVLSGAVTQIELIAGH